MKINSIKLKNIGPYKDLNIFDFNTNKEKNIILVGGKNGTGKTTLLKAIKIGLFGCFAFGYKSENNTYFNSIKNMLNIHNNDSEYYIEIDFQYAEHYNINRYILRRIWNIDEHIEESIIISDQYGKKLSDYNVLELVNKIKSLTSPSLINSFIYDGEKISSIIEQGQLEMYIEESFKSIFNINLLDQLNEDLTSYMIKSYKNSNKGIENDIALILNNINFIKSDLKAYDKKYKDLIKEVSDLNINIISNKKEFTLLGGLSKQEIAEINNIILKSEKENEKDNIFIKAFLEEKFPLVILINQIKEIIKSAKHEIPLEYAAQLIKIQDYLNVDFSEYIHRLSKSTSKIKYHIDEEMIKKLREYNLELQHQKSRADEIFTKHETLAENLKPFKEKLENLSEFKKLDELTKNIEMLQKLLVNKNEEINRILQNIKLKENELNVLIKKYEKIAELVKKDRLTNNSYIQCDNALKLSAMFKNSIVANKLKKISTLTCEIFNKTIRKQNYISKIIINENFEFSMYDFKNNKFSPKQFSAGEMQILVSSVIWAMFKISGRKEMFVFDTPLARLDGENRLSFIKNIIMTISDQVVILSTDSEFIGEYYDVIKFNLKGKYLLNYDVKNKSTKIENAYFGE